MQTLRQFDYNLERTRDVNSSGVENAVSSLKVEKVFLDQEKQVLTVIAQPDNVTEKQLTEAIKKAGGSVSSVTIKALAGSKL